MDLEFIYQIPLFVILFILLSCFLAVALIGYQIGNYLNKKLKPSDDVSNFLASTVFGLLALILGFTLSMAVSRYDIRKQLVLKESNAIGTAYLRADLLLEPYKSRIKEKLKIYTDERIRFYEVDFDLNKLQEIQKRTDNLLQSMWSDVSELSHKDHRTVVNLVVSAMNDVIDISAERLFVTDNHVPEVVYFVIFVIALIGLATLGYVEGMNAKNSRFGIILLSTLFALVIVLIQDLDRPRRGIIQVSQQSLYLLKQGMK